MCRALQMSAIVYYERGYEPCNHLSMSRLGLSVPIDVGDWPRISASLPVRSPRSLFSEGRSPRLYALGDEAHSRHPENDFEVTGRECAIAAGENCSTVVSKRLLCCWL